MPLYCVSSFFFSSRRRHTRLQGDWSSDVCSSDLLAAKERPKAIFAPVTSRAREFVARLAARLGVGLAADCVAFAMEGDRLVATRPVYAGKLLAKVTWAKTPWVATLRPNVFRPAQGRPGRTATVERPT